MNKCGTHFTFYYGFPLGAVKLKTSLVYHPDCIFAVMDPRSLSKPSFARQGGHTGQLLALEQLQAGTTAC